MPQNPKTACMRGTSHLYPATASGPTCSTGPDLRPYFDVCLENTGDIYIASYEDIQQTFTKYENKSGIGAGASLAMDIGEFFFDHYSDISDVKNAFRVGKDVGISGRMYTKIIHGKKYIIFKGNPRNRTIFTGTKYGTHNSKILNFGIGEAARAKSAIRGTSVGLIFVNAWNVAEFILKGDSSWHELVGTMAGDTIKTVAGSILGYIAAGAIGAVSASVVLPLAGGIVVAVTAGFLFDYLDTKVGMTKAIQDWVQQNAPLFQQTWSEAVDGFGKGYDFIKTEAKETVEEVSTLAEQQYENFQTGRRYVSDQIAQGWDRWFQTLMANVPAY